MNNPPATIRVLIAEDQTLMRQGLRTILDLSDGWNNKAIAEQLVLTEGTVKNYVSSILDKLHAANRTHASQITRKQGLIE